MKKSDIHKGLYVRVKGSVGVVRKVKDKGFCDDGMGYLVEFTGEDGVSSVSWWCKADELSEVRGV